LALVALLGALTFGALSALLIAVVISLIALIWTAGTPDLVVLGRTPGRLIFVDVRDNPKAETLPGLLVARPNAGIFFANAGALHDAVIAHAQHSAPPIRQVVLDLGASSDLDAPSADMLAELREDLRGRGIRLVLTELGAPARTTLERSGALAVIGRENLIARTMDAVFDYLVAEHDVADIQHLLQSGLASIRDLLTTRGATATAERRALLAAIVADLDDAINLLET
ncbi:MAG: sodium-independent anion transporter, partial [Chloroflexales bacterium]|nr:sodium-independent anion transporter [Chloroflexales bacterium]